MGKTLQEMTLEELWQLFPIRLEPHKQCYSTWYEQEARALKELLGRENVVRMNHIGSTAVEGLTAKAIIDILMEIATEVDELWLRQQLQKNNWICMSEQVQPQWRMVWNKGYTPEGFAQKVFHLHVRHLGDWDELYFRDYLIGHPEVCVEYAQLKEKLAIPYRNDRDGYTREKTEFVRKYTMLAREEFSGRYIWHQGKQKEEPKNR